MDIIVLVLLLLFAAGTFLVSLLQFIRQLINDLIDRK